MRWFRRGTILSVLGLLAVSGALWAITADEFDDFEDGTLQGWTQGSSGTMNLANIPDGGPTGAGDNYLRVTSTGTAGPGSRMAVFNTAQWTGDYNALGPTFTITMALLNEGVTDMDIRVGLEGNSIAEGKSLRYVSTTPFNLPATPREGPGGWQTATFVLSEADMTSVGGIMDPLSTALDGVVEFRVLSRSADAGWQGDQIAAMLGIDDIQVVSLPVELTNFTVE